MIFMADHPPESTLRLPIPGVADRERAASPLADEIIGLFDQFRDRLLRYVLSFGLPVPDGEDIVQEVFLSLYRHLQRGHSRSNLRAWMFRVAHNLALKRRNQARNMREDTGGEGAALVSLIPDPGPNPEDRMTETQRRQFLLAVVAVLPEQDRRCLVLRAEGLRYREIASVLEISLGSVALSLERSLTRLARVVQR